MPEYICPACNASCTSAEAQTADYRCPVCPDPVRSGLGPDPVRSGLGAGAYLIARAETPTPSTVIPEAPGVAGQGVFATADAPVIPAAMSEAGELALPNASVPTPEVETAATEQSASSGNGAQASPLDFIFHNQLEQLPLQLSGRSAGLRSEESDEPSPPQPASLSLDIREPVAAPPDAVLPGLSPIHDVPQSHPVTASRTPAPAAPELSSPPPTDAGGPENMPPFSEPARRDTAAVVVLPPPQNDKDATAMEQLIGTLAQLAAPIALEISGGHGRRQLILRGGSDVVEQVSAQLYAVYGQVQITPLPPEFDPAQAMDLAGAQTAFAGAQLALAGPEFLPIKTWREFEGGDPLAAILGAFDGLQPDERAISQIVIREAAPPGWADKHLEQLVNLRRRGFGADGPMPTGSIMRGLASFITWLLGLGLVMWAWRYPSRWLVAIPAMAVMALFIWIVSRFRNRWSGAMDDEATTKLREQAFQVEMRLFVQAQTEARAQTILRRLISAYLLFNTTSGNQLKAGALPAKAHPLRISGAGGGLGLGLGRALPRNVGKPALLNVCELAGMWHMPVGETLELVERQGWERMIPLPETVANAQGAYLGESIKGSNRVAVSLSPEALNRNIFIIGKTQHGKTTIMEHIATHWMRDPARAVLVVDPHGDLAKRVIGLVPPERVQDVIYVDLADTARSVALNLLDAEGNADPDDIAEAFVDVGKALWQKYWGPRMLVPLGYGLRALAIANVHRQPEDQFTILALSTLLSCKSDVREAFLEREVLPDDRLGIREYFFGEFSDSSPSFREQVISPVLSKAHAFKRSAAIRNLVGQSRSTVHLFDAIRERKIIVLNANSGLLRDDLAGFIGSLFLNVIRGVITRQTELPREERVRVSVIADEFQLMSGADFGSLLGELQKNGGNFVLGTQSLDNLHAIDEDGALVGRVFAGVTTTIALQANGADARYLVETELDFKRLSPESLINLPPFHAYVKTIDANGQRLPVFSLAVAAPLKPDAEVVSAVQAGRQAYSVPNDFAEKQVQLSIRRFERDYALVSDPDYENEYESGENAGEPSLAGPGSAGESAGGGAQETKLSGRDARAAETSGMLGVQSGEPSAVQRERMIAVTKSWRGRQSVTRATTTVAPAGEAEAEPRDSSRPRAVPPGFVTEIATKEKPEELSNENEDEATIPFTKKSPDVLATTAAQSSTAQLSEEREREAAFPTTTESPGVVALVTDWRPRQDLVADEAQGDARKRPEESEGRARTSDSMKIADRMETRVPGIQARDLDRDLDDALRKLSATS